MLDLAASLRIPVVAFAAAVLLLSACQKAAESPPPPPAQAEAEAPKAAAPIAPPAPPTMNRADLLQAMEASSAAYAAGEGPSGAGLAGRRFVVRQPFGCFEPAATSDEPVEGLTRWKLQPDRDAIELSLSPGDWKHSSLVADAAADWEAVEGFWLARPWLKSEACPGVKPDPLASGPPTPSTQTMGLAAVFEKGGSRLGRRNGRAYTFLLRGKEGQPAALPKGGLRLVLEGRLASFADGQAIHCRAASPDQRPICIAATQLDRVAFEDPDGNVLSDWRSG